VTSLVFAALFFFAIHVGIAGSQLRDRLVSRLGEKGYLGFFSLLSIVGITWLCWAYSLAPTVWWATPAEWTRPVAWGLVFVAFLFVGVGAATPSPTAMGGDAQIDSEDAVRGILRITRHPVLWGIAIWAAAHAIANPDVRRRSSSPACWPWRWRGRPPSTQNAAGASVNAGGPSLR
jgi:uncharacterized membrane protein